MNQGIFGFPSGPDMRLISVKEFDTSGYYSVPTNARSLLIFGVGAGGGGGAGRRAATAANAAGGGGGGGGSLVYLRYFLDDVIIPGSQLTIFVGAGGAGGNAVTVDNTNGNNGSVGGDTYIQVNNKAGFLLYALGGNFGTGGTVSAGTAGAARGSVYFHCYTALHGGAGSNGTVAKGTSYSIITPGASALTWHGGAGGGGFTNTGVTAAGGIDIIAGTSTTLNTFNPIGFTGGSIVLAGGAPEGGNGTSSISHILGKLTPGIGGAGGGGAAATAAGSGGNGYRGSGGGGGGGSRIGFNSGAGGAGGNGYVCILALE